MKLPRLTLLLSAALLLLFAGRNARAATFLTDTMIGVNDTNYDGQDIIVIGCTLTVDGNHAFSDILLIDNGTLTHTFSPNGLLTNNVQVLNESQTLTGTNYSTLNDPNVDLATVVVTGPNNVIYVNGADYVLAAGLNATTQIARTVGSSIPDGAAVAVSYVSVMQVSAGLNLVVSNNVIIEAGSAIDADGRGFVGLNGPGRGTYVTNTIPFYNFSGSGGSYGGDGGACLGTSLGQGGNLGAYGSLTQPGFPGSGGGISSAAGAGEGAGGGVVTIVVGGALEVDGQITANGNGGATLGSGGGSGGSIYLTVGDLDGTGTISANGGAGEPGYGGGGGGGRIAIYYNLSEFTGAISAHGGTGFVAGGAGTVYKLSIAGQNPQLVIDNGGLNGTNTPVTQSIAPGTDWTITNGAVALLFGEWQMHNLLIASNSALTFGTSSSQLSAANAMIQPGGAILVDGLGVGPGSGGTISSNGFSSGGGAGHGGSGAASAFGALGGNAYDVPLTPGQPGSRGGNGNGTSPYNAGGAGGGSLRLSVSVRLSLGGLISANGTVGAGEGSGGGSGGSVYITAASVSGAGTVSARGGAGQLPYGGGGGGGCIAIYSYSISNSFTGSLVASGGGGANRGGAGTIYTQLSIGSVPQLVLDNGGTVGTNTPLPAASNYDLTISGGAVATTSTTANLPTLTLHNLLIASNSIFTLAAATPVAFEVFVTGNGTIQAGGSLTLDGQGYPAAQGPGLGGSFQLNGFQIGGGAGHGGFGGAFASIGQSGSVYDVLTQPTQAGSGGGKGLGSAGGPGGGNLQLHVTGTLLVAGNISVNGGNAPGEDCGGGSGGAIVLTAGALSGTGTIAANGGAGQLPYGGGGGGGRIAIAASTNNFTGVTSAHGGAGAIPGGAGSIYIQTSPNQTSLVLIDNGGQAGTNTPLTILPTTYDLMITNGATAVAANGSANIRNLVIAPNSFLTSSGIVTLQITATSATIQPGGGIILDGKGYAGGSGPGLGLSVTTNGVTTGGGGGHGGVGGISALGAGGGTNYDTPLEPAQPGSGGGAGMGLNPNNFGGAGGGALNMRVTGTLNLGGIISANGATGVGQGSGGGAGGGIQLSAARFAGAGTITANGGAGESSMGGGGGAGGSISVILSGQLPPPPPTNTQFTGTMSAHGGSGFVAGGAGTVYRRTALLEIGSSAQFVVDNGGQSGATTPLVSTVGNIASMDLLITGGAKALELATFSFNSLLIGTNSTLSVPPANPPRNIQITVRSNATIQAGGSINVDGLGYAEGAGPGAGVNFGTSIYGPAGTGGGHGGFGGGCVAGVAGGASYDIITQPATAGSGGGSSSSTTPGGAGGGAVQLTVTGTLEVDGVISANGTGPLFEGSGGGSGGAVWLSAGILSGAGSISASGGMGSLPFGGGGGGGRIAIIYKTNQFAGNVSAVGGAGFAGGGAGTIYSASNSVTTSQLLVDNGGLTGTNTPISAGSTMNVTISGGANAQPISGLPMIVNNLHVGPGATLSQQTALGSLSVTVVGDALIDTNGLVTADGDGFSGAAGGSGAGSMSPNYSGSGAGYGGTGGASLSGVLGGPTYGSSLVPTNWGSRGGLIPTYVLTCQGGGAIMLQVGGALTVNGTVTANGNPALYEGAGGGSGGSVFLSARTLGGSGSITANGGAGEPSGGGGGGGGGRVAAYYKTNNFTGLLAALGGPGYNSGQTGTVYLSTNASPLLVISGTVTDISGQPVPNVSLQASGLPAVASDSNGNYTVPVALGWSGTVTPSYQGGVFVPGSLNYSTMSPPLTSQNYLFVPTSSLTMSYSIQQGTGLTLSWFGANGVQYQVQYSTDMINWSPYGSVAGTGGPIQFPISYSAPQMFFRISVGQ